LEATYPYTGKNQECKHRPNLGIVQVNNYTHVPPKSSEQLKAAIAKGPVSVALAAGYTPFLSYESGIFNDKKCPTRVDHAVTAVGYGKENDVGYYIIKNSWGTSYGENGYIKIAINDDVNDGLGYCGIQN
jgi:C1A family cysteine protease